MPVDKQIYANTRTSTSAYWLDMNGICICFRHCAYLCVHTAVFQEQWMLSMCVITHTSAVLAGQCLWCSSKVCIHNSSSRSSGQLCCSCSLLAGRRCWYCCRHSRCDPLLLHCISGEQPETASSFSFYKCTSSHQTLVRSPFNSAAHGHNPTSVLEGFACSHIRG